MKDKMEARFQKLSAALLDKAGGKFSLEEAAQHLSMSRKELNDKIRTDDVLGMMHGGALIIPKIQTVFNDGKLKLLPGISDLLAIFSAAKAGQWMALQFLVEPDPNLARTPVEALKTGDVAAVLHAARARLGLDEG